MGSPVFWHLPCPGCTWCYKFTTHEGGASALLVLDYGYAVCLRVVVRIHQYAQASAGAELPDLHGDRGFYLTLKVLIRRTT